MSPIRPSRGSSSAVRGMPVIVEDGDAKGGTARGSGDAAPDVLVASVPRRVPRKSFRRGLARSHLPLYVPSSYLRKQQQKQQPPFCSPPQPPWDEKRHQDVWASHGNGEVNLHGSLPPWASPSQQCPISAQRDRKRTTGFAAIVALVVAVVVALTVGLSVGLTLRHRSSSSEHQPTANPQDNNYPAGSYSFNTTLQTADTGCTSNPTTWRCYPYEIGSSATFFWIISAHPNTTSSSSPGSGPEYTISSANNPFAPSFANLSTTVYDAGLPSERLVFSFPMNKTVIPSAALTPANTATNCTFANTQFEATIWTRKSRANATLSSLPTTGSTTFADWPADVEVRQVMRPIAGQPRCVDIQGTVIDSIQAGTGSCECGYASFSTGY